MPVYGQICCDSLIIDKNASCIINIEIEVLKANQNGTVGSNEFFRSNQ